MVDEPRAIEGPGYSERGERHRATAELDEDARRQVIQWRVAKMSLREISDMCLARFGVRISHETVRRWVGEAHESHRRVDPERMSELRAEAAQELDTMAAVAWETVRTFAGTELALKAIDRLVSIGQAKMAMLGYKIPVRQDVHVHMQTPEDVELEEMINEAKARQANAEAAVVRAATEDPDL